MVDHFKKLFVRQAPVHFNGIPQLLIHVIARRNFGVTLAQFYRQLRIAFHIKLVAEADAGEQEQFASYFKNKRILPERQTFSYTWFCKAIFAKFFEVQWII